MLYIVSTPIGTLSDITYRAVETLKISDLILCEDTRQTLKLLNHYEIRKPLKAFHKFSNENSLAQIVQLLKDGKTISLVSDAGTPLISDPGFSLVKRCIQENIPFTAIPGACAAIDALVLSGFDLPRFQFVGFLPRTQNALKDKLLELLNYPGISICYESPERISKTVEALAKLSPNQKIAVARELTKKFEEVVRGTASDIFKTLKSMILKGEFVLLIEGEAVTKDYSHLSIEEHVALFQERYQLSKKEAIKMVAEQREIPKRIIYNKMIS